MPKQPVSCTVVGVAAIIIITLAGIAFYFFLMATGGAK